MESRRFFFRGSFAIVIDWVVPLSRIPVANEARRVGDLKFGAEK